MKRYTNPVISRAKTRFIITVGFIFIGVIITVLIFRTITNRQYTAGSDTTASARENLIADVPVYPGSQLLNSSMVPAGEIGYIADWSGPSSPGDISKWYAESLVSAGWVIDVPASGDSGEISYMEARKTDKYMQLSVMHTQGAAQTTINVKILAPLSDTVEADEQ